MSDMNNYRNAAPSQPAYTNQPQMAAPARQTVPQQAYQPRPVQPQMPMQTPAYAQQPVQRQAQPQAPAAAKPAATGKQAAGKKKKSSKKTLMGSCPLGIMVALTFLVAFIFGFFIRITSEGSALRIFTDWKTPLAQETLDMLTGNGGSNDMAGEITADGGYSSGSDVVFIPEKPGPHSDEGEVELDESGNPIDKESGHSGGGFDQGAFRYVDRDPAPPRCNSYDDPRRTALDSYADYATVEDDYFLDALFIGDSRIEGMAFYGALREADYLYMHGTSVWNIMVADLNWRHEMDNFSYNVNFFNVLRAKSYNKIYIMLGINELGNASSRAFKDQYQEVINEVRDLQPDAIIYILGIMNVTAAQSESSYYINNDAINSRNYWAAQLADGKTIFYIDVNPAVCDENGCLKSDWSSDGVHLRAEYYIEVTKYLKTRAILTVADLQKMYATDENGNPVIPEGADSSETSEGNSEGDTGTDEGGNEGTE